MRGFYVTPSGWPGRVHELRDGDYPLCGCGTITKQPITRTERMVTCPRCLRCISDDEHNIGKVSTDLNRGPY